jgi:hypothetical protein
MKKYLLILILLFTTRLDAQTINAASCSSADILTALNSASQATVAIIIPSGSCTWATAQSWTISGSITNLTFQGQTTCVESGSPLEVTCTDGTTISDGASTTNQLWQLVTGVSSTSVRVTGLTFQGNSVTKNNGLLQIRGSSQNVRVDHCHFVATTGFQYAGIFWNDSTYGVNDHDLFTAQAGTAVNFVEFYNGFDTVNGDQAWNNATGLGSANFTFVEDSTFDYSAITTTKTAINDCFKGGKLVFRYNTIINGDFLIHPTGGAGRGRGCRAWEMYKNTFVSSGGTHSNVFFLWSGTGVFWGNTAPVGYAGNGISLHAVLWDNSDFGDTTVHQPAPPNGWGYCGPGTSPQTGTVTGDGTDGVVTWASGSQFSTSWPSGATVVLYQGATESSGTVYALSGSPSSSTSMTLNATVPSGTWNYVTGSAWDQNSDVNGYACLDQPGRGQGDLLSGNFPNACDASTTDCTNNIFTGSWPSDALEPIYIWLNTGGPPNGQDFVTNAKEPLVMVNNRDYYEDSNGNTGVTSGLLSARPGTCTPKVGYWATDTTTLYQCIATNTWGTLYTPYTYPHPLVGTAPLAAPMKSM